MDIRLGNIEVTVVKKLNSKDARVCKYCYFSKNGYHSKRCPTVKSYNENGDVYSETMLCITINGGHGVYFVEKNLKQVQGLVGNR